MKKKQLVCGTLAAAMMLSTAAPGASAASFSDSVGHWGESSIDRWTNSGVLNGTDNAFHPNTAITRGEMATILAELLGLEQRANNTYPDLNGGWYTDAMLKCAAAGIMTGDDHGQMRPYDNVTGAEIAVILNKALDLSSSRANYPATSTGYVKPWAQSYVDAIASRGIAVGNNGGVFEPMEATSRAAFVSMLDRAVDTYISSPGSYTANGLTIVNTTGTVTLRGTPTSIDITESATGSSVVLDHTNVSGTVMVRGGRVRLTADHASLNGDIQVRGYGCTVSLEGTSNAGTVQFSDGAGSGVIAVTSDAEAGQIVTDASNTTMNITGTVNNIRLDNGANNSSVNIRSGAKVENLSSTANDVTVSGTGTLRRADIDGTNTRVTTPNTIVNSDTSSTTNRTRSRVVARRRPSYSDRYTVTFYADTGSGRRQVDSQRVYNGDHASSVSEPIHSGDYIFDHWEYERYYYGEYDWDYYYYDGRYYNWYDWDYWYKNSDWKWDSSERAYRLTGTSLWYDDSTNRYFTLHGSVRSYLKDSDLYGYYPYYRSDKYYYGDDNWVWSKAKNAYYNEFGNVYHDSDGYFIMDNGVRRYITASEARDRLGAWYVDSWYKDGYYLDGYWYPYGYYNDRYYKDGRWYYDGYYYNYRVGDTFSFSDRIYGTVDLIARWKPCVSTSDPGQVQNLLNSSDPRPVKYTGIADLGDLNLNGKELYLVHSVKRGTFTGGGTVSGPGKNGSSSGGSVTPTPPSGSTIQPENIQPQLAVALDAVGTVTGTNCVIASDSATVSNDKLTSLAQQLVTFAGKLPSGAVMTVNTLTVTGNTKPSEVVNAIMGYESPLSRAFVPSKSPDQTTVKVTYPNQADVVYTITYLYNDAADKTIESRIDAVEQELSKKGISGTCTASKARLSEAITAATTEGQPASGSEAAINVTVQKGSTPLTSTAIQALSVGDVVTVYINIDPYATVTIIDEPDTSSVQARKDFETKVSAYLDGKTITIPRDSGDPTKADSTALSNVQTAISEARTAGLNVSTKFAGAISEGESFTITLTDHQDLTMVLGTYTVKLADPEPGQQEQIAEQQFLKTQQMQQNASGVPSTTTPGSTTTNPSVTPPTAPSEPSVTPPVEPSEPSVTPPVEKPAAPEMTSAEKEKAAELEFLNSLNNNG